MASSIFITPKVQDFTDTPPKVVQKMILFTEHGVSLHGETIISSGMRKLSKNALIGYPAGIITGIAYGLNPLFGMPLMNKGVATESILFFRYTIRTTLLNLES